MSHPSTGDTYQWNDITKLHWWLDNITCCRRKKSTLEFLRGVGYLVGVVLILVVFYYLHLHEKTGIDLRQISGGLLPYVMSSTNTAFILALFSGFIIGRVYKSPKKIGSHLISWRHSWEYHYNCVEALLEEVKKHSTMTAEEKELFNMALQSLYQNIDTLKSDKEFRGTKNPYEKLQKVMQLFLEKLQ